VQSDRGPYGGAASGLCCTCRIV